MFEKFAPLIKPGVCLGCCLGCPIGRGHRSCRRRVFQVLGVDRDQVGGSPEAGTSAPAAASRVSGSRTNGWSRFRRAGSTVGTVFLIHFIFFNLENTVCGWIYGQWTEL